MKSEIEKQVETKKAKLIKREETYEKELALRVDAEKMKSK